MGGDNSDESRSPSPSHRVDSTGPVIPTSEGKALWAGVVGHTPASLVSGLLLCAAEALEETSVPSGSGANSVRRSLEHLQLVHCKALRQALSLRAKQTSEVSLRLVSDGGKNTSHGPRPSP
jgi:hypothetical protein